MVQVMKSGSGRPDPDLSASSTPSKVKMEIFEASFEETGARLPKRSKISLNSSEQIISSLMPPTRYHPLDEPSPLGLRLRKSPSLLDLIQMRLSQGNSLNSSDLMSETLTSKKEGKPGVNVDKLKASNFPATIIRIGSWEYKSRYEGDLVAKCYFAKHKLVWEILEGGLKSKIEIQWSDIMGLKANCLDSEPGTLDVVVARQPLFFRETNPQPRKHTLWQATGDFTNGQASLHRQHFLQCPPGLLTKHFEKLIQCDTRLNFLSRQPEITLDSPFFEQRPLFDDIKSEGEGSKVTSSSTMYLLKDLASPDLAVSSSEFVSRETSANESDYFQAVDSKMTNKWDKIKLTGMQRSVSVTDLMNKIETHLSGGDAAAPNSQEILEDLADYLLADTNLTTTSDEQRLMARVESLCCLLGKEEPGSSEGTGEDKMGDQSSDKGDSFGEECGKPMSRKESFGEECGKPMPRKELFGEECGKPMSKKESFGELLLHLPRIASLPKFLFGISEGDGESQAR